jgi:3,4-dihydroxy 2-butanone 4-phosphate synthase/GTP cyclohydrolase II
MARGAQLAEVARRHRMPLISVADVVAHRRATAPPVHRLAAADLPTPFGPFRAIAYRGSTGAEHVALVRGEPARAAAPDSVPAG